MKARGRAILLLVVALLVMPVLTEAAPAQKRRGFRPVEAPVRLFPLDSESGVVEVGGLHDYFGEVQLRPDRGGLVVVNRLALERYLLGLAEVPTDWPPDALRAQAVAARTYALHTLNRPRAGAALTYDFDICASVQCQVFSGADVVRRRGGRAWSRAVAATAREAVVFRGRPILARYHSTSGGRTFDNADAFPKERNYPYLQSVPSRTERASPLYRWEVRFSLADLQAILERAGRWLPEDGSLEKVETVTSRRDLPYPDVSFRGVRRETRIVRVRPTPTPGRDGSQSRRSRPRTITRIVEVPAGRVRLTNEVLRTILRSLAPRVFPGLYPSLAATAAGRLPETLPSERYRVGTRGGLVIVKGRGWGHGVGMSQWGAYGMARAGESYTDILSHYYTRTKVEPVDEGGRIDVGVAWGRDLVKASGPFRIVDGRGRTIVARAHGVWTFSPRGDDRVAVVPPKGFGRLLTVGIVSAPESVDAADLVSVDVVVSRPARVRLGAGVEDGSGAEPVRIGRGRTTLEWAAPSEGGTYRLRATASTSAQTERSSPVLIEVQAPAPSPSPDRPRAGGPDEGDGSPAVFLAIAIAALVAVGIVVRTVTMKR